MTDLTREQIEALNEEMYKDGWWQCSINLVNGAREIIAEQYRDLGYQTKIVERNDQHYIWIKPQQAPQFQPANEVRFKIDLGVPFYLVEMKPSEPEQYVIHSCFGSSAEDALARQVSTLQSKLNQPAPPSDVVDDLVKALKPFADEAAEWDREGGGDDGMNPRIAPSYGEDVGQGGLAKFTVGDLRRARAAIEAIW